MSSKGQYHISLYITKDEYSVLTREATGRFMSLTALVRSKLGVKQSRVGGRATGYAHGKMIELFLNYDKPINTSVASLETGLRRNEVWRFIDRARYHGYLQECPTDDRRKKFYILNEVGRAALEQGGYCKAA